VADAVPMLMFDDRRRPVGDGTNSPSIVQRSI
jgi:hypothetical protein